MEKREKITAAEIALLKERAEAARAEHYRRMALINDFGKQGTSLSDDEQIAIIKGGNIEEINSLLAVFSRNEAMLNEESQLWLYSQQNKNEQAKKFMLSHNILCFALEKRLIDDDKLSYTRQLSAEAEKYLVLKVLKNCLSESSRQTAEKALQPLQEYVKNFAFSEKAQVEMMNFLYVDTGRDKVIDMLENFVYSYVIEDQKRLVPEAQLLMVRSRNHRLILDYIQLSEEGLTAPEAVDELLKNADREEVEAYFMRYPNL